MLIRALVMLAFAAVIGQPAESAADTRRYAVLIGLDEVPGRQLPPLRHALVIDPTVLLTVGPFPVTDPAGTLLLQVPAVPWARPVLVQAVALSSNPGYAPGSFTNVVRL